MKRTNETYKTILFGLVFIIMLAASLTFYTSTVKVNFQNEITNTLKEVTYQSVNVMETEIAGKLNLLKATANSMSPSLSSDYNKLADSFTDTCIDNEFKRMGIITPDGTTYTSDHVDMNLADRSYFKAGMNGQSCISQPLTDKIGAGTIIVYSTPIYESSQIKGVLFATYDINKMQDQLALSSFDGQGYCYIVDAEGNCIIETNDGYFRPDNIISSLEKMDSANHTAAQKLQGDLSSGRNGSVIFNYEGKKYMYYAPMSANDWYVITTASANALDKKMNTVLTQTFLLSFVLCCTFLFIIFYILKLQNQKQKELWNIAYIDKLTKGYTYTRFLYQCRQILQKPDHPPVAFLQIDIDDFKFINDTLGYSQGDLLICYIHDTLSQWCRTGEVYAHQSADNFVVMAIFSNEASLTARLDDLCRQLQNYSARNKNKIQIVPSIGIYVMSDWNQSLDSCLDCARIAGKSVKGKYDVYYTFYDEKIKQQIYYNKNIEAVMDTALEKQEFKAYYQPKYDSETGNLVGAEALVRWEQEDGVLLPPSKFIPLFEANGFISSLDTYMFHTVCAQQKLWLDAGLNPCPVSVNISRKHLYDLSFIQRYSDILQETGLPPNYIQLEITESIVFDNHSLILEIINKLHQMGIQILLDDFGTGYSSMAMLKNLTFDILKIDKSFVDYIGTERGNKIVDGIILLSHSLGMPTVAEGVETEAQYQYLKKHNCDMIQGYYFSKPLPDKEYEKLY